LAIALTDAGANGECAVRFSATATADRLLPQQVSLRLRPILDRVDALFTSHDDRSKAGRTTLTAFAIRIASAALAFLSQVLLARWMGGFEYGIFVLVWTTIMIVGNLSCFGFHTSVVRYIPEYRERGDLDRLRGVMVASRVLVLVVSTVLAGLGAAAVLLFSDAMESYYVVPFVLGIVCLPMIAFSDTLEGIARANSWAMTALAPIFILRPILILLAMGGALFAGFPADAKTALIATIFATYATTIFQMAMILPHTGREVEGARAAFEWRTWILVSLPIFLIEGFFFLLTNADVLVVGYFMTPADVAIYFATVKVLALVHFVYFAVKAGAAQRYAQYAHAGDTARLKSFARETTVWTFWPSLLMAAGVLAVGQPMLSLFGPGFESGYPLLFILLLGVVARASVGPAEALLTMTGHQNACAVVLGLTLAVNVGLNIVLIPAFGLWGAALSTALAMTFEAIALALTIWKHLGIVMFAPTVPIRVKGAG
jgi:O-antigen/teichoic acid export membrane protein